MRNTWITNKQFLAYCRKPRSSPYRCGPLPLGTLCVWVRGTAEHPRCTWIWRFYSKGVEERWGLGPVSGFVSGLSKAKAYAEKVALAYLQTGKDIRKGRLATGSTITDLIPVYLSAKEKRDRAAHEDIVGETSRLRGFEEILGKYNPAELTPNLCADACNRLTYKDSAITYPLETRRRCLTTFNGFLSWCQLNGHYPEDRALPTEGRLFLNGLEKTPAKGDKQPYLDYREVPRFVAELTQRHKSAALALLYLILTTDRAETVIGKKARQVTYIEGLKWKQIDTSDPALWLVHCPAIARKIKDKDFLIPLSTHARSVLRAVQVLGISDGQPDSLIFPNLQGAELSENAMCALIKRMDTKDRAAGGHGFRDPGIYQKDRRTGEIKLNANGKPLHRIATQHGISRASFRTWVDVTGKNQSIAEECLGHLPPKNSVLKSYQRNDHIKERAALLEQWGSFCMSQCSDPVMLQLTQKIQEQVKAVSKESEKSGS